MSQIKKPSDDFPRTQRSHIPRNISARALATSRRITAKQRRGFNAAKDIVVEAPRTEPKLEQEVFCRKLKTLPLEKLGRRARQCKQRHAKATRLLAKVAPSSKFRPALEQEAIRQVYRLSWVVDEIKSRCIPKPIVPKTDPFALTTAQVALLKENNIGKHPQGKITDDGATLVVYES